MKEVHVGARLPQDLVKSVDTFAREQTAATGVKYTRTDAIRRLLTLALGQLKTKEKR